MKILLFNRLLGIINGVKLMSLACNLTKIAPLHVSHRVDGVPIFCMSGDLDFCSSPRLMEEVENLIDKGYHYIGVDLGNVEFIDHHGLELLAHLRKRLSAGGGELKLFNPSRSVLPVLAFLNLSELVAIVEGSCARHTSLNF